ncbi:hypothetical protein DFH28DRAFT_1118070 [Melampsora americana]|nr:hypothetical protein DFH28DRAFT_1118070 [Melampsora americana]
MIQIHFFLFVVFIIGLCVDAEDVQHSGCYNYFLKKDNCVHSSSEAPCASSSGKTINSCNAFKIDPTCKVAQEKASLEGYTQGTGILSRRYDTTIDTHAVAGGTGICGYYDTNTTLGVCLWSGEGYVDSKGEALSGWLNGTQTKNCNKKVYIQRQGKPETVQYAEVLDGCGLYTTDPSMGCFQAWMTILLFDKFNPTKEERKNFKMNDIFTWEFVDGSNPV